jgi:hypothetical protein
MHHPPIVSPISPSVLPDAEEDLLTEIKAMAPREKTRATVRTMIALYETQIKQWKKDLK